MARPEGFEPPAPRFVVWCSIQLSYGRLEAAHIRTAGALGKYAGEESLPLEPGEQRMVHRREQERVGLAAREPSP